jgi:uncharacterized protein YecE (DUF72 family)
LGILTLNLSGTELDKVDLFVGTSGYSYKEWCGSFYPEKLPASEMLAHYAQQFNSVEINSTFYRMPAEKTLADWASQVPEGFSFVLKTSRRITHLKRLKGSEEETSYLLRTMSVLGEKLGPMLVQLPPNATKDTDRLRSFTELLPLQWQTSFEFRHSSWFDDEVYGILSSRSAALVATDMGDGGAPLLATTDWGYLRLRREEYSESDLLRWRERILEQDWRAVYVFFKHEDEGAGPKLARRFRELLLEGQD